LLKKFLNDYSLLLTIALVIVVSDQITKYLVRNFIPMGEMWTPWTWLAPYARIVHWQNTGAAFGMFQRFGGVFTVLAILVSIAILYYFPRVPHEEWPLRLAMGMQLGGAIGNLIDRLTQGYVTDFISIGNFAVFNIADACISVGVAVLIVGVWIMDQSQKKPEQGSKDDPSTRIQYKNPPEAASPTPEPDLAPSDPPGINSTDKFHRER
jgi:signal peptidase II